jgi:hypothetical protein
MGQRHAPASFYPRERPCTHYTAGWVSPRAGLDKCGKSCPTGIRFQDRPARSQSLYWVSYPARLLRNKVMENNRITLLRINTVLFAVIQRIQHRQCDIETRSYYQCCNGKPTRIACYKSVSVNLVIHHEMRMCHIIIWGLSGSSTFFHNISQTGRKSYWI